MQSRTALLEQKKGIGVFMSAMELPGNELWSDDKPEWCELAVCYDDQPSRDAAVRLCHNLARRFKDELDFTFSWWKFKYLADTEVARQGAEAAGRADLLIFSIASDEELPLDIKHWIDQWLPLRRGQEGALTALTREARHPDLWISPLGSYLRTISRRAQLDFLSPRSLLNDDAWERIRSREQQVTPLLDEILRRVHPVSHWGLNE